jgi:hypothetical protein
MEKKGEVYSSSYLMASRMEKENKRCSLSPSDVQQDGKVKVK